MANNDPATEKTPLNPTSGHTLQGSQSSSLSVKQLVDDYQDEEEAGELMR